MTRVKARHRIVYITKHTIKNTTTQLSCRRWTYRDTVTSCYTHTEDWLSTTQSCKYECTQRQQLHYNWSQITTVTLHALNLDFDGQWCCFSAQVLSLDLHKIRLAVRIVTDAKMLQVSVDAQPLQSATQTFHVNRSFKWLQKRLYLKSL